MATAFKNGEAAFTPTNRNFGQIGLADTDGNLTGATGFNSVITAATSKINTSANEINALLANYDPSNPASLLVAQQAMANYNLSITVASSFIKSIEDTTKAVAQHVS